MKVHVPSVQVGGLMVEKVSPPYPPGLITAAVPPGVIITSGLRSGWAKKYQLLMYYIQEKKNLKYWKLDKYLLFLVVVKTVQSCFSWRIHLQHRRRIALALLCCKL